MLNQYFFYIVLNILFILVILEQKFKKKKMFLAMIGIIILSVVITYRNRLSMEVDYNQFKNIYYNPNYRKDVEKIYLYLNIFFHQILNFTFIQFSFIYGMISLILVSFSFNKLLRLPNLGMFIYYGTTFFPKNCVNIRSGLSTSIFIFSLYFLLRKEYLKYIINILIATGIHFSGILYLSFVFINEKIIKKYLKLIFIIALFLSVLLVFIDIKTLFLTIAELDLGRISERIKIYFEGRGVEFLRSRPYGIRGITIYINYIIYYFLIKKKYIEVSAKEYYFFLLLSISVVFKPLSYKVLIFARLVELFNIVDIFIIMEFLNIDFYKINLKFLNISFINHIKKYYKVFYFLLLYFYITISGLRVLYLMANQY